MRIKIAKDKRIGTAYPYISIRRDDPIRAADHLLKSLGPGYCQLLFFALNSFHESNNGSLDMKDWEDWRYGNSRGQRDEAFQKVFEHIVDKYPEIEMTQTLTRKYGMS